MAEIGIFILGLVGGMIIAFIISRLQFASKLNVQTERLRIATEQRDQIQKEVEKSRLVQLDLEKNISSIKTENQLLREKINDLSKLKEDLNSHMEDIMRKVHEASHDRATKTSKEQLSSIISPFKEQLDGFGKTVRETYDKGSKETLTLKNQLENFNSIQQGLIEAAQNLTRALKGDSKVQGDWGEMVLEKLLESAGLREGHEFIVQGKGLNLKSEEGQIRKPDIVVRLPAKKDIIIDSKVSLTSYERFFRSETDEDRTLAANELVESIEGHVKDLSKKEYASLYGINSPDYVLMFIPIDGAFLLATQTSPKIYQAAMEKGVQLISPSFLMPALRMIHNMWERDKQSKNAIQIAEQAGRLYDKFVDFVSDIESVQAAIGKAGAAAEGAMKKLQSGSGNILGRVEGLRTLGAKTKKQLNVDSENDDEKDENSDQSKVLEALVESKSSD